jgi:hypothetical protein
MKYPLPQSKLDKFKTVRQFRDYFQLIPSDRWCVSDFASGNQCCARGHVGARESHSPKADQTLLRLAPDVAGRNNGYSAVCPSRGIKTRVLKYLTSLIKKH